MYIVFETLCSSQGSPSTVFVQWYCCALGCYVPSKHSLLMLQKCSSMDVKLWTHIIHLVLMKVTHCNVCSRFGGLFNLWITRQVWDIVVTNTLQEDELNENVEHSSEQNQVYKLGWFSAWAITWLLGQDVACRPSTHVDCERYSRLEVGAWTHLGTSQAPMRAMGYCWWCNNAGFC